VTYREPDPVAVQELARAEKERQANERASDLATIAAMKRGNRGRIRVVRAIVAFVVVSLVALPLLYWLAMLVSPAQMSDGYMVMPIGQAAFAIVFAPVLGLIAGYIHGRR
jgi:hypothetical protein